MMVSIALKEHKLVDLTMESPAKYAMQVLIVSEVLPENAHPVHIKLPVCNLPAQSAHPDITVH